MFRRLLSIDFTVFIIFLLLLTLSLITIYSIFPVENGVPPIFIRQSIYVALAIFVALSISVFNYNTLRKYSTALYFFIIILLTSVLFLGKTVRGTVGWLDFGLFQVQPVEIAKILIIIFLASFITSKRALLGEITTIVISFGLTSVVVGLTLLQPDMGSALVILAIWLGMIIVSGISKKYIISFVIIGAGIILITWTVLAPYQRARITNFLHPESDPQNTGYNVIQSIIAVGNGGLTGRGIGYGTQSQLNFLPEKHTDFIFAAYTESLGFLGALFLLILFLILFIRLRSIAIHANNDFGYFLIIGITILLWVHTTVNIGMNIGLLPVTGIPLPFVSYGGSALLSMATTIGLTLSIYRYRQTILTKHVRESY